MACDTSHERALMAAGHGLVAGIDEAGRGPLAGPVAVAAVILPPDFELAGLDDSKKLSARAREKLYDALLAAPGVAWKCVLLDAAEIDRLNVLGATHEGMRRAALGLTPPPDAVLIDGLPVPRFPLPQRALVGGDGLSLSIAAASIIAKVTRDRVMLEMDRLYPEYRFAKHKGYGTREHIRLLEIHGPCPIHRRSFAPVAQTALDFGNR